MRSKAPLARKTLILPVLLYGSEAWTISASDAAALRVFERKILRRIFGPKRVEMTSIFERILSCMSYSQIWILTNASKINGWLGHVMRMAVTAPASKLFDGVAIGTRQRGATRLRWKNQLVEVLTTMGVTNWTEVRGSKLSVSHNS